jgi:hypothetical protein
MTGQEDDQTISLDCVVYPNPAISEVRLKIDRPSIENMNYKLRNNTGLIIGDGKIESRETIIPMKDLPAGVYLLTLIGDHTNISTWKVIKK